MISQFQNKAYKWEKKKLLLGNSMADCLSNLYSENDFVCGNEPPLPIY